MELCIFAAAWCLAGMINHVVGLGAAMVAMPIIIHFIPLQVAVPSSTLIVLVLNIQLAWSYRQSIQWLHLLYILAGGIPGAVAGIFLITSLPNEHLKILMGIFLICYAAYALFFEKNQPKGIHPLWGIPTGLCSTFFGTAFGFNGPPLAVFTTRSGWNAGEAKGFLGTSFILSGLAIISGQFVAGLQTTQTMTYFVVACPASLVGGLLGIHCSKRFIRKSNRTLLLCVLFFAGFSQLLPFIKEFV